MNINMNDINTFNSKLDEGFQSLSALALTLPYLDEVQIKILELIQQENG